MSIEETAEQIETRNLAHAEEIYQTWCVAREHFTKHGGYFTEFARATIEATRALIYVAKQDIKDLDIFAGFQLAESFAENAGHIQTDTIEATCYIEGGLMRRGGYDAYSGLVHHQSVEILWNAVNRKTLTQSQAEELNTEIDQAIRADPAKIQRRIAIGLGKK